MSEPTQEAQAPPVETTQPHKKSRLYIIAGIAGNVLEWFDFGIYAYFAVAIAANFFAAQDDPIVALLSTFLVFGLGFVARPIGGFLFGHFGDKIGRKNTLSITVILMGISTFAIGCLPSYEQAGAVSTICLVVFRILQGMSAGGEWGNVLSFLGEYARPNNRGFIVSWAQVGAAVGLLCGSLLGLLLSNVMTEEALLSWGWRIPFLAGILIAAFGYILRRGVEETPVFQEKKDRDELESAPLVEVFRSHGKTMLAVFLMTSGGFTAYWLFLSYMPTFFRTFLETSASDAYLLGSLTLAAYAITIPFGGILADKRGRKPQMLIGVIGIVVVSIPVVAVIIAVETLWVRMLMVIAVAAFFALFNSAFTAAMPELFPAKVRVSGVSVPYNLGSAAFGGTCSYVATALISSTGNPLMLPIYITIMMSISLVALIFLIKETKGSDYSA